MPFATIDELRDKIAADLQKSDPADLAVDNLTLQTALTSGERVIRRKLGGLGYSASDILAGDELQDLHLMQSLYWAYMFGGVPHGYDLRTLEKFDRVSQMGPRDGWLVGNAVIWPGAATAAQPGGAHGYAEMAILTDYPLDNPYHRDTFKRW